MSTNNKLKEMALDIAQKARGASKGCTARQNMEIAASIVLEALQAAYALALEEALAAIEREWKGCPYETEGCHDVDANAIRALIPKENQ